MRLRFDLQFFGGKTKTQQVPTKNPEPEELKALRTGIYNKIYPGLQSFDAKAFTQAQNTANQAMQQQSNLLSQLPNSLNNSTNIANEMLNVTRTGNIPSALTDNMNASVNSALKSGMGDMLNNLGNSGVLNSSVTSSGINNLAQNAANAYSQNYLTALNTTLGGYGQALQGAQNNTNTLMSGLNLIGQIPNQAYQGAYAGLAPAMNFWQNWQNSYDGSKDFDTVVTYKKGLLW